MLGQCYQSTVSGAMNAVKFKRHVIEAQNDPEVLALLTAQRHKYAIAKRWLAVGFSWDIGYAVLMGAATFWGREWLPALATLMGFSIGWTNECILRRVSELRILAATVQQWVDCKLFSDCSGMDFSDDAIRLSENDRIELIAAYHDSNHEKECRWYADYSMLSPQEEIYRCQMENISWNGRLKRSYACLLVLILAPPILSAVIAIFVCGVTCAKLVLLVAWFVPLVNLCVVYCKRIMEDRRRFETLCSAAKTVDLKSQGVYDALRGLQKLIFEYRKNSVLIPETIFWWRRGKDQDHEDKKAAIMCRGGKCA